MKGPGSSLPPPIPPPADIELLTSAFETFSPPAGRLRPLSPPRREHRPHPQSGSPGAGALPRPPSPPGTRWFGIPRVTKTEGDIRSRRVRSIAGGVLEKRGPELFSPCPPNRGGGCLQPPTALQPWGRGTGCLRAPRLSPATAPRYLTVPGTKSARLSLGPPLGKEEGLILGATCGALVEKRGLCFKTSKGKDIKGWTLPSNTLYLAGDKNSGHAVNA